MNTLGTASSRFVYGIYKLIKRTVFSVVRVVLAIYLLGAVLFTGTLIEKGILVSQDQDLLNTWMPLMILISIYAGFKFILIPIGKALVARIMALIEFIKSPSSVKGNNYSEKSKGFDEFNDDTFLDSYSGDLSDMANSYWT